MRESIITAVIAIIIIYLCSSCSVTTSPDGTQTRTPDYNAWLEITRLILADEIPQSQIDHSK